MKKLSFVALILCATSFAQTNVARMLSGVNAQTGTSYTFIASDVTKIVTFNNANPVGATLPVGTTTGFGAGSVFTAVNLGAGTVTIACSGCTINGAASIQVVQNQSVSLYGDGTNYISAAGGGGGGGSIAGSTALGTQVGGNGAGGFASITKAVIDPRDYGVDCSDTNDSTTAWAAAVTAAGNYGKIVVPAHCLFKLTGTPGFSLYKVYGLEIEFAGRQGNGCDNQSPNPAGIDYRQSYASGNTVVSIIDSQRLLFKNLTIYTNGGADNGILIDQDGSTPPITTRNDFYNPCIYNNTASRNSSWKGINVSPTSINNVENIHFYHPDVTCSQSSPLSSSSNGFAILFGGSANVKNEIVDDYNAHNCSQDVASSFGGDITFQFGLASNSYNNIGMGAFNDSLYGFRSESATNAVSITNAVGPHLIYHNDFAASAGTIIDCPSGCGTLTLLNNEADSTPANWFNVHGGGAGASGPLFAAGNRFFSWNPTDFQNGAFVLSLNNVTSTASKFLLTPSVASGNSIGGNSQSPAIDLQSDSGVGGSNDDYIIQNLPSGVLSNTPASSTLAFGHSNTSAIAPWLASLAKFSGLTLGQITNTSNLLVVARGATGATSYSYQVVAHGNVGTTPGSNTSTIANGNATLSVSNFNFVEIPMVGGCTYFDIYRTASGGTPNTTGKIGTIDCFTTATPGAVNVSMLPFSDTGLSADGTTPPTINTTGKILTAASSTGAAGLNLPHGTAPTTPIDGDFWTTTTGAFVRINGGTIGPLSAGGGGGLSGMTTLGMPIATSPTNIATSTTPGTNQGTYVFGRFNSVQGVATSPIEIQAGDCSSPGVISGASTTYTIIYTDVINCKVTHDIAATQSATITIPPPATLNNPAPIFVYSNYSTHTDTLTPSTYQISMGSAAAGASLSVPSNVSCNVHLDYVNGSTYKAECYPMSTSPPTVTFSGSTTTAVSAGAGVNSAATGTVLIADGSGNAIPRAAVTTVGLGGVWSNGMPFGMPPNIGSTSTLVNGTMYIQQLNLVAEQTIGNATFNMVTCSSCAEVINACMYNSAGTTLLWSGISATINGTGAFSATGTQATLTRGVYYFTYSASGGGASVIQGYTSGAATTDSILNKNGVREGTAANGISGGACPATLGALTGTVTAPAHGAFGLEP